MMIYPLPASVGFGTYRIKAGVYEHEFAMQVALENNVRIFDTASIYTNGSSEQALGAILTSSKALVAVTTKLGIAEGTLVPKLRMLQANGLATHGTAWLRDDLAYSIHPEFLERQLETSCRRLNKGYIEVVLLHNPEMYLQWCVQHDAANGEEKFYFDLTMAFRFLEDQREQGYIGQYGFSSNAVAVRNISPDTISLERVAEIGKLVGGFTHGLRHLQIPFNIIEHQAATDCSDDGITVLDLAETYGMIVTANRPLNAIVNGNIIRLATHAMPSEQADAKAIEQSIHSLEVVEHDVLQTIIRSGVSDDQQKAVLEDTFRIAGALCQSWNSFEGLIQYREMRNLFLEPRLDVARMYPDAKEYVVGITELLARLDDLYTVEENESLEELRLALAQELELPADTPLQRIALAAVRFTPGITSVLIGMRSTAYVRDVLSACELSIQSVNRDRWLTIHKHLEQLSA